MQSTKPYLLRAIHEWCADQGFTPYLVVRVDDQTRVPRECVDDGQIVLNVSSDATHQLRMGNTEISFQARFSGASFQVVVPVDAVAAIYARENGQGLVFETPVSPLQSVEEAVQGDTERGEPSLVSLPGDDDGDTGGEPDGRTDGAGSRRGAHLTRVK